MSNRPAPQFRPRRSKPSGGRRRKWLIPAAVVAALLIFAAAGTFIGLAVTGGGDDSPGAGAATPSNVSQSTGGTDGGEDRLLNAPAVGLVIQLGDLPGDYRTYPPETYLLAPATLATNGIFAKPEDADQLLPKWGYDSGYQVSYQPGGQLAAVLQGKYYIRVESMLFSSVEGARVAYAYIENQHASRPGSERQATKNLGNQSSAFKILSGTVGPSELPQAFHRFVFRRGNLVAIVQTMGVDQYMTVDKARDLAIVVDDKALGKRPAPTPTPPKGGTPAVPPPPTPTATR